MQSKAGVNHWSPVLKGLHWGIALLVIIMLGGGFFLGDLPESMQGTAYMMHKSTGLTILLLMLLRLISVWHIGRPGLPESSPRWEKVFSRVVQYGFYVFLILMPLSGWIMSMAAGRTPVVFGLFALPLPGVPLDEKLAHTFKEVHESIAITLLVLLFFHVAGALKHHFINRDNVLRRMWLKG